MISALSSVTSLSKYFSTIIEAVSVFSRPPVFGYTRIQASDIMHPIMRNSKCTVHACINVLIISPMHNAPSYHLVGILTSHRWLLFNLMYLFYDISRIVTNIHDLVTLLTFFTTES